MSLGDDIDLHTYYKLLADKQKQNLSLKILKEQKIDCINTTNVSSHSWKVYNCLFCEIEIDDYVNILSNGKWYQIEKDYVTEVSNTFNSLKYNSVDIDLPTCKQNEHEDKYNERVEMEDHNFCNMDRKLILHGGANQKIEFCDLFTNNKKLIHVKHSGGSSVLSHLFSQGVNSGELLLSDEKFRAKLNQKLDEIDKSEYKLSDVSKKPNTSEYEIIFAIISKFNNDLNIPFFSKVSLKNAKKKLELMGYKVSLLNIKTEDTV